MLLGFVLAPIPGPWKYSIADIPDHLWRDILASQRAPFWSFKRKPQASTSEGRRKIIHVFWILLALCVLAELFARKFVLR